MCVGCPGEIRMRQHREAVSVPQARHPLPWPKSVAAELAAGIKAHRLSVLKARAWLRLQPDSAQRAANYALIQQWEQQLLNAERQIIRVGVESDGAVV